MIDQLTTQKLQSDKYFAMKFAVDNNPLGVIDSLRSHGYGSYFNGNLQEDKTTALKILSQLTQERNQKIKAIFDSVNYLNNDSNSEDYTKGYRNYFIQNTPTELVNNENYKQKGSFSFDGMMAAIGAGLLTYNAAVANGGIPKTQEEKDQEAQAKAEADTKKKRNTIIWVVVSVIGVSVIIGAIVYFSKKDKK